MRNLTRLAGVLLAAALAACSSSSDTKTTDPGGGAFQQPAGTVAVNFKVDDTANHVFGNAELEWKGAMVYDPVTRKITKDATWGGPWAPLYDDGPWSAGGHEPAGSVAGDHILGVTVFATPPAAGGDIYEFGLNDPYYQTSFGNGWLWRGTNGQFTVNAGATAAIDAVATPFVLPAFGTNDLELVLDPANLDTSAVWDLSVVKVKGSATAWSPVTVTSVAGKYTFHLSDVVGAGKPFNHSGLLSAGDKPEFIWVLGAGAGVEYKDTGGVALATGVSAQFKAGAGAWAPVAVQIAANNNTYVEIPVVITQPAGTVAVNFRVDDTANQVFSNAGLEWKGAMVYDPVTRRITKDATWSGPWAPLYDDGPWSTGGHEPAGETAGDHIFGITVFATPPAAGTDTYEFGLQDPYYQTSFGNGWIWRGANGSFAVAAGATAAIDAVATPFVLLPFGNNDLELVLDPAALDTSATWDTSVVKVKGSGTAWSPVTITQAAGVYTFHLSDWVGAGNPFSHSGLLSSGDMPEFIWVLGSGAGVEYKDTGGIALATGVTAQYKPGAGAWAPLSITLAPNNNTRVTIP